MRRHLFCFSVVLLGFGPGFGQPAGASHAPEPLKTTVASSDLILIGTLGAIRVRVPHAGVAEHEGTITVEQHLAGDPVKGGRCTLSWSRGKIPSGGIDHRARLKQRGIWLLQRAGPGRYAADSPARFQPIAERARIEELIRTPLFLVDTSGWSDGGKACCVKLMIRTFRPILEVRDYLSHARGKLLLHGRARVEVQGQLGDPIAALPGKTARGKGPAILVTRERPHVVEIDLRRHFALVGRKGKPGREVFHLHWGTGPDDRSPSYSFGLD
jgi:hypothetical protein